MPKKLHSPMMFQSTPSGGKATAQTFGQCGDVLVSIHAFRGEGDDFGRSPADRRAFVSIHAFRGEGDRNI